MYVNLYGNSATLQTLYLLQGKFAISARIDSIAHEGLQISNLGSTRSFLLAILSLRRYQARSLDQYSTIPVSVDMSRRGELKLKMILSDEVHCRQQS